MEKVLIDFITDLEAAVEVDREAEAKARVRVDHAAEARVRVDHAAEARVRVDPEVNQVNLNLFEVQIIFINNFNFFISTLQEAQNQEVVLEVEVAVAHAVRSLINCFNNKNHFIIYFKLKLGRSKSGSRRSKSGSRRSRSGSRRSRSGSRRSKSGSRSRSGSRRSRSGSRRSGSRRSGSGMIFTINY